MNIWLERLFLALIFSLGFMQPGLDYAGIRLIATDIIFVVLSVGLATALALRQRSFEWDINYVFFAVLALAMGLSAAFSVQPKTSGIKFAGILYLIGLAALTINLLSSVEAVKRAVLVWIAASTIVSLIAAVTVLLFFFDPDSAWQRLFLHHYGSLPVGNYPRIQATFIYPAMLCNYLSVGALMLLGAHWAGWIGSKFAAAILLVHLIAAGFTLTPGLGGFAAALAFWVAWLLFDRGRKRLASYGVAVGVFAVAIFTLLAAVSVWPIETSPYSFQLFNVRLDPTQRFLAWQAALGTLSIHPVFGKGIGLDAASVLFRAPSGQLQMITDAHNTLLSVAAQSGIIGLAAFLALCSNVLRRGLNSAPLSNRIETIRRAVLIAFFGGFFLQGLVGSFEDARHLWVLLGLSIALDRLNGAEHFA